MKKEVTPASIPKLLAGDYDLVMKFPSGEQTDTLEVRRGEATVKDLEFASAQVSVLAHPPGAKLTIDGKDAGVLPLEALLSEGDHEFIAQFGKWPGQRRVVHVKRSERQQVEFEFLGGSVKITSAPGGAIVSAEGRDLGPTPLLIEDLEPGEVHYTLRLPGFKELEIKGQIQPGEQTFLPARFSKRVGPRAGEAWENSLGMKFAPVGQVLVGIWPVRVQDYDAFCLAVGRARSAPDFPQGPTHPVVKVSWEDATAFVDWLTAKERGAGRIEEGQRYRLPTDMEWSLADEIPDEGGTTPEERDGKGKARDFPWGSQWPPPAGAGNFADGSVKRSGMLTIPGYRDGFPQTSPVGSFQPNRFGLFDMCGNVWQWCLDPYKGGATAGAHDWGVLRGGSWGTAKPAELRASYRSVVERSERDVLNGFRCVLDPNPES